MRERPDDIALLVQTFLEKARAELGRAPRRISAAASEVLARYRWPGNIRELQNVIRSVALFCESETVNINDLAEFPELFHNATSLPPQPALPPTWEPPRTIVVEAAPPPVTSPAHIDPPRAPPPPTAPPPTAPRPAAAGDDTRDVLRRVGEDSEGLALGDLKRRLEFEAISNAIRQTAGNVTRAAALLKMKRPRLSQIINGNPELRAIKEALRSDDEE